MLTDVLLNILIFPGTYLFEIDHGRLNTYPLSDEGYLTILLETIIAPRIREAIQEL